METKFAYVGVRIISRLKELNLKQADLCRESGISSNAISQYCTGKRVPDTTALLKIASVLKTSMEWILTGKDTTIENTTDVRPICDGVELSQAEADLVAMFRLLDARGKETVFDIASMMYEKQAGEKGSIYSTYTEEERTQKSASGEGLEARHGTA